MAPSARLTLLGEITIAIPGTLMVAAARTFPLVMEVAVSETVKSPKPGGVYVVETPLAVVDAETVPHDGISI